MNSPSLLNRIVPRDCSLGLVYLERRFRSRDPQTLEHSLRVAVLAGRLGQKLGLDYQELSHLKMAAHWHDVGKIFLPEKVLAKPSRLSVDEYDLIRGHPALGERLLAPLLPCPPVLAAVRGHHENYDGTGYPDRLAGENIPYLARILAVADCYDALISSRTYRPAWPVQKAVEFIHEVSGKQFDPEVVKVFETLLNP